MKATRSHLQFRAQCPVGCLLLLLLSQTTVRAQQSTTASPVTQQNTTLELSVTTESEASGDPVFVIDKECRVPTYASINYETVFSAPVANDSLLVVEGQCYISCMESLSDPHVGYEDQRNRHTQFPPWPYYTLKEGDCGVHQYVHECTRGCVINNNTPGHCETECLSHCSNDCGHFSIPDPLPTCNNPDSDELWVLMNCPLTCAYPRCSAGCNIDKSVHCTPDCRPPLTPAAPPTLIPVVNTTSAGMYTIDLTHTVPPSDLLLHNVAFLFEIQDNTTGNYSYHWLVDPRTTLLDLADFSCREVTVRFAVANLNGLSGFSEGVRIPQVYGVPQFINDLQCKSTLDNTERKLCFNLTWTLLPYFAAEDLIEHYNVSVELVTVSSGDTYNAQQKGLHYDVPPIIQPNETEFYHCVAHQEADFPTPHSNHKFRFNLSFISKPNDSLPTLPGAKEPFVCITHASLPQFINDLQCNSTLDNTDRKLCFNLTWTLPSYFAAEDLIEHYNVSVELITVSNGDTYDAQQYYVPPIIQPIEAEFYHCVAHQEADSPTPHSNHTFRFNLSFVSNSSGFPSTLPGTKEPFVCIISDADLPVQLTDDTFSKYGVPFIVTVTVIAVVLFILSILIYLCAKSLKKQSVPPMNQTPTSFELILSDQQNYRAFTTTKNLKLLEHDEWEIPFSEVIIENQLGTGEFGKVYNGVVRGPLQCCKLRPTLRNGIAVPVAVKMLKETAVENEKKNFLSEIDMMKMISEKHHPNVIGLVGCVTIQEPLCLILEVASFGDFLSYLRTNRKMEMEEEGTFILGQMYKMEQLDLIKFPYQIASGMEYLSSKGIVHRDLACRNILLDRGKVLKITDFGLSRKVDNEEIYVQRSKGRVPLKWMSPESILTCEFTTASDVWSYGITLWEIGTMGSFPYPNHSIHDLCPALKGGYRMEKPEKTSLEVYNIMLSCWDGDPSKRPTFTELKMKFDKMLLLNTNYFHPINNHSCSQENALKELASSVLSVPTLLSPNSTQNRMSLGMACINESSHSSLNPRRRSTPTTPGQISRCHVNLNSVVSDSALRAATGSDNTFVAQDNDPSRAKNVYVKNPSEQLLQASTQATPSRTLRFSPSADAIYSQSSSSLTDSHGNINGGRYKHSSMIAINIEAASDKNISES